MEGTGAGLDGSSVSEILLIGLAHCLFQNKKRAGFT